ncbi:DUF6477 family protein [Pontivivens nitratireducens]|jgi:hypothetical protein|uniref:Uncharacterized protein n=1 Tax=Pontivivens nitratireducens TaxID=2758038 RepID=A0A6G7VL33_9RHOB|nr:DUF6477 family protein [Pontibrevibacter nitratireducens]QIK40749.1 hypothetical protein G8E03_08200 [Pontibrevibacter nitratireducens]
MKIIAQPTLRRPRSLIAAATQVAAALKGQGSDITSLTQREGHLDQLRRMGDAAYSPLAHVTALARLLAARRCLL